MRSNSSASVRCDGRSRLFRQARNVAARPNADVSLRDVAAADLDSPQRFRSGGFTMPSADCPTTLVLV